MIGRGWDLGLCGLEKLLISLVDEARDFTADQNARLGKETRSAIIGPFNGRGNIHLLHEDAVFRAWSFQNVKSVIAKPVHGFFIRALLSCCRHSPPDADSIPNTIPMLPRKKQGNRYCRISGAFPATLLLCKALPPTCGPAHCIASTAVFSAPHRDLHLH